DVFLQNKIIDKVELKEGQIRVVQKNGTFISDPLSSEPNPLSYSNDDIERMQAAEHVVDVEPQRSLPNIHGTTSTLVEGKELHIYNIKLATDMSVRAYLQGEFNFNKE